MPGIEFEKALNREQLAAVTAPDGPCLVLAAAGTGKTRTLVYRVAYLVERGVKPDQVLLLTFTNRAAGEMLERAKSLVGPEVSGIWGGTFHHMANRILRQYAGVLDFPNDYGILDRDDSRKIVSDCVKGLRLESKEFPKPAVLLGLFNSAANTETPLEDVIEERFSEFEMDTPDILRVHEQYEGRKKQIGAMDFDDLLVNCVRLFRKNPGILQKYQNRFAHVLVDEYQDTNKLQAEMVDSVAATNRNVVVVGDDFQSIYSWRGADFRNIMSFPRRYPDARTYILETNYRSVPEILRVANACIARNPEQFQKTLRPTREAYRKPVVARIRDGAAQARYVTERIMSLRREGYKFSQMAVLYRAHFHAMELELELKRLGVDYWMTSGVRFFEQAHIKDVCAILRILVNPGDEMAFLRLIGLLPGMGEKTAAKIWEKLGGRFDARDPTHRDTLRELLRLAAAADWAKIDPVLTAYWAENLREDGGEVIYRFTKAFYERYALATFENARERLDDISELILYTAKFDSAEQFLSDVALVTNLDEEEEKIQASARESVRLSTVHQAKGLEWSVVFVIWMVDGMFPSSRTLQETPSGESEERRLFYVAVTRAKDELCLCVPEIRRNRDGGVIYCRPSRFVEEIPGDLVREDRPAFV